MNTKLFFLALLLLVSSLDFGYTGPMEETTVAPTPSTTTPKRPKCNEPGIWSECLSLGLSKSTSYDDCLNQCKNDPIGCSHFTFTGGLCEIFFGNGSILCDGPNADTDCPKCMSGEKACDELHPILKCEENFCCTGKKLKTYYDVSFEQCLVHCNDYSNVACKWFSHYTALKTCQLFETVETHLHEGDGTCLSGQKGCDPVERQCALLQVCDGSILDSSFTSSSGSCLKKCQEHPHDQPNQMECLWVSFHKPDGLCYLFNTCENPFDADGNFISGESRCQSLGKEVAPGFVASDLFT